MGVTGEVIPPHLSSEPERFAMKNMACTLGGAAFEWAARFSDVPRPRGNGA